MKDIKKVQLLYKQTSVQTAPPEERLISQLSLSLQSLCEAKEGLMQADRVKKNKQLQLAQEYLLEAIPLIDQQSEEGRALISFFDYMNRRLIEANMDHDQTAVEEVEGYLQLLREDWQAALHTRRKKYRGNLI